MLFTAFAAADLTNLATTGDADLFKFAKIPNASETFLPLIKSITKRHFLGVTRTPVTFAVAAFFFPPNYLACAALSSAVWPVCPL